MGSNTNDLIYQIVENAERKQMSNAQKIIDAMNSMEQPVTMKQLQDALEMTPGVLSGTLFAMHKRGQISKEKVERSDNLGPKMKFVYKVVANSQQGS